MKLFKILLATSVASIAAMAFAADSKPAHPPGKQAGCCVKAAKEGHACDHKCCVEAAKNHKNCEKCKGTNETHS